MATTYTNNENGADAANPSDRTLFVTHILTLKPNLSLAQVKAMYEAVSGRRVHADVMESTMFDAERRGMIERAGGDVWRIRSEYWDAFAESISRAFVEAA